MTKRIPLANGMHALVDDEDFDLVMSNGPWHTSAAHHRPIYALHSVSPRRKLRMHHLITGAKYVDHVNGDGLDNRRSNLRPSTHWQNMGNRGKARHNTSGYKGVVQLPSGRWRAQIAERGVGTFDTPEQAARAYDRAAVKRWGEFAWTNFPHEIEHEEQIDMQAEGALT